MCSCRVCDVCLISFKCMWVMSFIMCIESGFDVIGDNPIHDYFDEI